MKVIDEYWIWAKSVELPRYYSYSDLENDTRSLNERLSFIIKSTNEQKYGVEKGNIFIGAFPTNSFNASAVKCRNGSLLLINFGLMNLIFQIIAVYVGLLPVQSQGKDEQPQIVFEKAIEIIRQVLSNYNYGILNTEAKFVPLGSRSHFSHFLFETTLLFVIAHEYAHVISGHLSTSNLCALNSSNIKLNYFIKSWEQETEADILAIKILKQIYGNKIVNPDDICLGACIFFEIDRLLSGFSRKHGFEVSKATEILTHPPSNSRRVSVMMSMNGYTPANIDKINQMVYFFDKIIELI